MNLEKHRRHFLLNMNRSFQDRSTSSLDVASPEVTDYYRTCTGQYGVKPVAGIDSIFQSFWRL